MSSLPGDSINHRALRRIGTNLCGRYRITRLIGMGGMAAVYEGVHRNGHTVAIKILHERLSADSDVERLFRREAQLANKIRHPGLVPVIDDDVTEDGCTFLVMPLLVGETVRARARRAGEKLTPQEVTAVAHSLLQILASAHAAKVVHRDIKPENLFITHDGSLRVLDLGIARFFETTDPSSVTRSGRAMGTPAFMAPEQALGRIRDIDGRTDIWAVGATMFTLLSGQFVHEAESASEALVLAATRKPRRLVELVPELPEPLCAVIDRALAFDKIARWPDATTMAEALTRASDAVFGVVPSELPRVLPELAVPEEIRDATTVHPARMDLGTPSGQGSSRRDIPFTAVHTAPTPRSKPSRGIWFGAGVVILALTGSTIAFLQPRKEVTSASATKSAEQLTAHLEASRNAWLDGNFERARAEAQKALDIDDTSAAAHFAALQTAFLWPRNDDRAHFVKAQEARKALSKANRVYIEAIAPTMTIPADFGLAAERLAAIHAQDPADVDVVIALAEDWLRMGRMSDAIALLKPFAEGPDVHGVVLAFLALAQGLNDEVEAARETYHRCVSTFPASSLCTRYLAQLELNEGRCAAAERVARQDIEANPKHADAHLQLAFALQSQGASTNEIRPILKRWAELLDGPDSTTNMSRVDLMLALHEGRLQEAREINKKIGTDLRTVIDDDEHFFYVLYTMLLEVEAGDHSSARDTLTNYATSRHGLRQDTFGGDNIMFLNAYATRLGLLPWSEWITMRDARLAKPLDRYNLLQGRQRTWMEYYAFPTTAATQAKEAVNALPAYLPMLPRLDRWFEHDTAIGNVFSLNGDHERALQSFERGVATCARLDSPIEHTQMILHFGEMLERSKNLDRACQMYKKVLSIWPVSFGSQSAAEASRRASNTCREAKNTTNRHRL